MQFAESAQAVQVRQAEENIFGDVEVFPALVTNCFKMSVPVPHRFYTKWSTDIDNIIRAADGRIIADENAPLSPQVRDHVS